MALDKPLITTPLDSRAILLGYPSQSHLQCPVGHIEMDNELQERWLISGTFESDIGGTFNVLQAVSH